MHWAPWNDSPAQFDTFDRYAMSLGHCDVRPDYLFYLGDFDADGVLDTCALDCASAFHGLGTVFASNVLEGSSMVEVVQPTTYTISPAATVRAGVGNVAYVPYPEFEQTYTWRDSRLVTWDMQTDSVVGLGGARDPASPAPNGDRTASASSPWGPDDVLNHVDGFTVAPEYSFSEFVRDPHDFLGDRARDHDPIAMPLLVDFRVSPDDTVNAALSFNVFWIGHVGPQYAPMRMVNGWYNSGAGLTTTTAPGDTEHVFCQAVDWPHFRVHSTGGIDLLTGQDIPVFPDDELVARGGVLLDVGLGRLQPSDGLFQSPPADSHVYWGQVDFVRRVSLVTTGFFDTLRPNQHALDLAPGLPPAAGRPDFMVSSSSLGLQDIVVTMDPPVQPSSATVELEMRGVDDFANATLYEPVGLAGDDDPLTRGNLLNPNYSCEAYRYASPNPDVSGTGMARVSASGFTPYFDPFDVSSVNSVRDPLTGLLPRYLNLRVVMNAGLGNDPADVAFLESVSVTYRMSPGN